MMRYFSLISFTNYHDNAMRSLLTSIQNFFWIIRNGLLVLKEAVDVVEHFNVMQNAERFHPIFKCTLIHFNAVLKSASIDKALS